MLAAMRDTSLSYRTYWLRDGEYYGRRSLGETAAACSLPLDKLAQIPAEDRQIVIDEANADPAFCEKLTRLMATNADWAHLVANSAKEAIVNELDPSRFGHRAGMWRKLRERLRAILKDVPGLVKKIEAYRASGRPQGLGQWDIIGNLVGAIGGAAANIYGAKMIADTQKDIARIQTEAAIRAANAQMATAQAQQAMQNPVSQAFSSLTTGSVAGIPMMLVLPALGAAIYFATKK